MAAPVAASANAHDPWLIARNRFIDQLDPAERALFNEATPENLYYKSSNIQKADQKNSKTRAILKSLEPLTKSIQDYGAAMDTVTNIAPLLPCSNMGKYSYTFARVGDILPRLRDYQAIFDQEKHPKFTQTLSAAYLDIIVLCSDFKNILTGQKSSFVKRLRSPLFTSLGAQLDNAVQTFREHRKAVEGEAKICHYIEAKESRELELRERMRSKEQERRDRQRRIISQMATVDCRNKHRRLQNIRHHGTGSWLAGVADYRNWKTQNKSSVMSCYGIPGSGKSVLVSSLIDGSKMFFPAETAISYYYCDYADKRTLSPSGLFSFISQELFRSMAKIPDALMNILEAEYPDETSSPGLDQTVALLIKAIDELPTVAIFVDGLDELPESDRRLTFSILRRILNEVTSPVKLFVSSREDITYLFQTSSDLTTFKVHLQTKSVSPDIEAYVRHAIDELFTSGDLVLGNLALKEDIFNVLRDGAKGMFLWVKFQLEELCRMETDATIIKALQNLPRNLEETYDRLLGRIIEIERREFVKRMFDWIICSCRPLHMDELREAIAFTIKDKSWDATKIPNDLRRLIRACRNLIMIDEDTLEVHLAHYTVEQYILYSRTSELAYFHTTKEVSNRALGATCVTYLSFTDLEAQVTVYHNTVTRNMAVLQNAVTTQSLIPRASQSSNIPVKAARTALMFQRFNKDHEHNIDYSHYIKNQKQGTTDQQFLDKYWLIRYLRENWFSHTKDFTEDISSEIGESFKNLLFNKELTFSVKPWDKFSSGNCAKIAPLCWALAENHLPLLKEVLANDQRTSHYIIEACLLFWNTIEYQEVDERRRKIDISNQSLEILENRSLEEVSSKTDCLFWLYSQMIIACQQGNSEILLVCVKFIDETSLLAFPGLGARCKQSLTLKSLVFAHLNLEASVHGHLYLVQKFQTDFRSRLWAAYEYEGSYFNPLERAITLPYDEITDYLIIRDFPVSNRAKLNALETHNIKAIVESGDFTTLERLVKFLRKHEYDVDICNSRPSYFGTYDEEFRYEIWRYKLDAIETAASLGLCNSLHVLLSWEPLNSEINFFAERHRAFLTAIACSHLNIIKYLLLVDHYKDQRYWFQSPAFGRHGSTQGFQHMSLVKYVAENREISEEFKVSVLNAISSAEDSRPVLRITSSEKSDWSLIHAIAEGKTEAVIRLGGRKHFDSRYSARNLTKIPLVIGDYLWPDCQSDPGHKEAAPLVWAVIYNRPQVVEALLSQGISHKGLNTLEVAATCAVIMDSVEIFSLLEEVRIYDYDPTIVAWGCRSNFFAQADLIDRALARGKHHQSKPYSKVARYIDSWVLWHWRGKSPDSTEILREHLK
ncbi:hypothetical protein BCON_0204g00190 [Botryotinia convoluta]|uniref:NACHT domain-containing protein n=1 Tax=Botryotinia convoluta TaxID=54673 RepID=A0A4Z1HLG7_9HELO|nr:hypothetical protein BCON_0204g00190 [Botryotinia convoluta]